MALASSGSLNFSQIAAEFGGTAPHSLSEYYPLLGQGVTGLPSSGTFNFSHFHGKDKDVLSSVWTTSGYNQSYTAHQHPIPNSSYYYRSRDGFYIVSIPGVSGQPEWGASFNVGSTVYHTSSNNMAGKHWPATQWIDTSGYVDTWTVAAITG